MSKNSFLPSLSRIARGPSLLALTPLALLAFSCATVAGFENFSSTGSGGVRAGTGGEGFHPDTGGSTLGTGGTRETAGGGNTGGAGTGGATIGCVNNCQPGNECYLGNCRPCGGEGQSCCDNSNPAACTQNLVCVPTNSTLLQNVCTANCGARNQNCCQGGNYVTPGCQIGSGMACNNRTCS
jgi:hypothetical protein